MDSEDGWSGGSTSSESSSSSMSSSQQVGQKRKREQGSSSARQAAAKIARAAYDGKSNEIYCPVCQAAKKRGKVADLKALEQHCATKSENGRKHKSFLKILRDVLKDTKEIPSRSNSSASKHEILQNQGLQKHITPSLLILRNVETEV